MKYISNIARLLILALFIVVVSFSTGNSTEIDDATVFVDAFNAYQQKDYLLTVEKCDQLNKIFPDSPLRDVTLLLTARASLKSGDNTRAAKSVTKFLTEFPESSLNTSVEDELRVLANRYQKGEVLPYNKILLAAARKVRSDRMAQERAAALKLEMERIAKEKAEQERVARIKLEAENREKERVLAEKRAKSSIKVAIMLRDTAGPFPVGDTGTLPVEISNEGKNGEDFLLTLASAPGYDAIVSSANKPEEKITQLHLDAGETFKGFITFKMPPGMVDGHRSIMNIQAVSAKFSDVSFQKKTVLISSAPLVRAVAKLARQHVAPGEKLRYRVTVLNAGSLSAKDLTVRVQLPPNVDFQGTSDVLFKQEPNGALDFKIDQVEIGKLAEINLDVKIREDCPVGQELRGHVEVDNASLQRKAIFTANASVVK
ncbi:MAG: outer membrane protein assembly factor BamD [Desulfuromonadaceae bacterium]|nr:outer membrane protein assembly factor BamD [Desulfuromonadaceae bacterium]